MNSPTRAGFSPPSEYKERVLVIACGVLRLDIERLAETVGLDVDTRFLEGGLHEKPRELRRQLQAAIDQASAAGIYARIGVGYGVCGRGAVGLKARRVPLILPRVHDCIALFLGGDRAYREQFRRFPGTYYLSAGWQAEKRDPLSQQRPYVHLGNKRVDFDQLARQVGSEAARDTFEFLDSWKKNYQRAVFIDTGAGQPEQTEARARALAAAYGWRYERIQGDTGLLKRLLTAKSGTPEILVVPPGQVTFFDPLSGGLGASAPVAQASLGAPPGAPPGAPIRLQADPGVPAGREAKTHPRHIRLGLGIDAGGTYTDAVLFDFRQRRVLGKYKALTTKWDFTRGIDGALSGLDGDLLSRVELVALSTTLATNAIVEGDGQKVGLLLMTPYGLSDPRELPYEPKVLLQGALEISGRVQTPVDQDQVRRAAREMVERHGVEAFAVSGFAGAINPSHEIEVKGLVGQETGCLVTCGHELSDLLNFKTRAETAVLNARIVPRLVKLLDDLDHVLSLRRVTAPVMVVKGDGSLMGRAMAAERPVETILSGPAASVAGARFLTGRDDALVVDMGGTTTDTAALVQGRVETAPAGSRVGRIQTHVQALKIRTWGLGGDSRIDFERGQFTLGPRRVAPLAWLASRYEGGAQALDELRRAARGRQGESRFLSVLALSEGGRELPGLSAPERRLLDLLSRRPRGIDALARRLGILHPLLLPLGRLEARGLIQRCGLTPTDLLHVRGDFVRWDAEAARQGAQLLAETAGIPLEPMVARIIRQMIRILATELIKKELEPESDPEALDHCPVCRTLLARIFRDQTPGEISDFTLTFQINRPIIGIGAPIAHFLPPAAALLGAEAVMPPHADVANAVGAVTSHIRVQRQLKVRPDAAGGFYVEGLPQAPRFAQFDAADHFARSALARRVRTLARAAGTGAREVEIRHRDRTVQTAQGETLFLERTLTAQLSGPIGKSDDLRPPLHAG